MNSERMNLIIAEGRPRRLGDVRLMLRAQQLISEERQTAHFDH